VQYWQTTAWVTVYPFVQTQDLLVRDHDELSSGNESSDMSSTEHSWASIHAGYIDAQSCGKDLKEYVSKNESNERDGQKWGATATL
jgi:hypothetical protein